MTRFAPDGSPCDICFNQNRKSQGESYFVSQEVLFTASYVHFVPSPKWIVSRKAARKLQAETYKTAKTNEMPYVLTFAIRQKFGLMTSVSPYDFSPALWLPFRFMTSVAPFRLRCITSKSQAFRGSFVDEVCILQVTTGWGFTRKFQLNHKCNCTPSNQNTHILQCPVGELQTTES